MRRFFIILFIIIIAGLFIGTGYFLYQKSEEPEVVFETDSVFVANIVVGSVGRATGLCDRRGLLLRHRYDYRESRLEARHRT